MQKDCYYKVINRNRKCFKCKAKQQRNKLHERLADQIYFQIPQKKIYLQSEPPSGNPPEYCECKAIPFTARAREFS